MIIINGHPNLVKIHSYKNFDVITTVFVLNVLASTHLVAKFVATNMYMFLVYLPTSLISPTKCKPHFMNGFSRRVVTNLAKLCVANALIC